MGAAYATHRGDANPIFRADLGLRIADGRVQGSPMSSDFHPSFNDPQFEIPIRNLSRGLEKFAPSVQGGAIV
jgi:hypothetical protein